MNRGRGSRCLCAGIGRALLVVALVAGAAACSRGDAAPQGALVKVHEHDFSLTTSLVAVRAGLVTFRVQNAGPSTHEFIVARTTVAADALPLQKDDISVNEDSPLIHEVGSLDQVRLGATRDLTLKLPTGDYVLFCNLSGHYRGGMYALLEVTA